MRDDGGSAFPFEYRDHEGSFSVNPGMTLRDYFAAQCLTTILATPTKEDGEALFQKAAEICYRFADAMIAERNR